MRRFISGFSAYFGGLKFWLSKKRLLALSIFPLLLSGTALTFGLVVAFREVPELVAHVVHRPEFWYQYILYYLSIGVTGLTFIVAAIFLSYVLSKILLFPFSDLLSEKTLNLLKVLPDSKKTFSQYLKHTAANFVTMMKRTLVLLILGLIVTVTAAIPGLGFLGALFAMFVLALDVMDYSFDHYRFSLKERRHWVTKHWLEVFGFSLGMGLTVLIPVVNLLMIPASVVSAACLVARLRLREP